MCHERTGFKRYHCVLMTYLMRLTALVALDVLAGVSYCSVSAALYAASKKGPVWFLLAPLRCVLSSRLSQFCGIKLIFFFVPSGK